MSVPTEQLLEQARNGDRTAFAAVFEQYRPLLCRIAYRLVGADDFEDVVMDTYLKVWKAIPRFQGRSAVRTWLCRVTHNCALDHLRRRRRQAARTLHDAGSETEEGSLWDRIADDGQAAPDRQAGLRDLGELLRRALDELTPEHRQCLLLREVDGLSYRDTAAAAGISIGTVMSRLFYAKRRLRQILRRLEIEP
ncbi:MAG: sigma-70 family RNA polymerase sigma factor [Lentisphaeria bacterium]|nr:sigma-70 family RNA polymerase sigma factor [Lentisphaeria bacterium]